MTLTVIIADISPLIHEQLPAIQRSVKITLTKEQEQELKLRNGTEKIAYSFIEPEDK